MQIAVDARFFAGETASGEFTDEVFPRLATQHAQHTFIFLVDEKTSVSDNLPSNVSIVKISPGPANVVLYKWWYELRVPLALKKHKADVFVCTYGLCSLTTSVPQVLIVQNLPSANSVGFNDTAGLHRFKGFFRSFLKKAEIIGVPSNKVKQEIAENFKISSEKIIVTGSGASDFFKPVFWEEREEIKEKYADGCEYFIYNAILHSAKKLLNMLKAFAIFKKWQKTNMKLILMGAGEAAFKDQAEKLNTYKYKNEIVITKDLPKQQRAKVVAGSYAAIFFETDFVKPLLEAMQSEVLAIIAGKGSLAEIAGDAALFSNTDPEEIAAQMKRIFKDEQLRSQLIKTAKDQVKDFSWDKAAAIIWQMIEKAVLK